MAITEFSKFADILSATLSQHHLLGFEIAQLALYIFEINPLSVASFAIIFSHSEGCLFTLFIVSFVVQKLLILIRSHLLFFLLFPLLLEVGHRGSCYDLCQSLLPMFSSRSFIVSGLKFRSLIHFEFIFVNGVRKCSSFNINHSRILYDPPPRILEIKTKITNGT